MARRENDRRGSGSPERATRRTPESIEPPERDEVYGVVSVLYHALKGSEACGQFIREARSAGDDELAAFFRQCRLEQTALADRAKALLFTRLEEYDEDEPGDELGEGVEHEH
jgi:hypothetical protein